MFVRVEPITIPQFQVLNCAAAYEWSLDRCEQLGVWEKWKDGNDVENVPELGKAPVLEEETVC